VGEAREKAEINKEEGTLNIQDKNQVTEHVSFGDIDKKDLRQQNSEESLTSETSTSASSGVEVARGPVDHGSVVDYTSGGSCQDSHDGTRCVKHCAKKHLNCDQDYARCWQGHCKRGGHHPCDTSHDHACCCGNCYLPKDHPDNLPCFEKWNSQVHQNTKKQKNKNRDKKKTKKNKKIKNKKVRERIPSAWKHSMTDILKKLLSKSW